MDLEGYYQQQSLKFFIKMNPNKVSRKLSLVLRHDPSAIDIQLDENGWTDVSILLNKLSDRGLTTSMDLLEKVVRENDKQRFSFNEDKTKIRANQGHSIQVDLGMEQQVPPETLYHGTASRFIDSIQSSGLEKRNRQHVHLSEERETATKVGQRHGRPVILLVAAKTMHEAGHQFYLSQNGVWLTDSVPTDFIINLNDPS